MRKVSGNPYKKNITKDDKDLKLKKENNKLLEEILKELKIFSDKLITSNN